MQGLLSSLPGTAFTIDGAEPDRTLLLDAGAGYRAPAGFFAAADLRRRVLRKCAEPRWQAEDWLQLVGQISSGRFLCVSSASGAVGYYADVCFGRSLPERRQSASGPKAASQLCDASRPNRSSAHRLKSEIEVTALRSQSPKSGRSLKGRFRAFYDIPHVGDHEECSKIQKLSLSHAKLCLVELGIANDDDEVPSFWRCTHAPNSSTLVS